jgi:PilZ domain
MTSPTPSSWSIERRANPRVSVTLPCYGSAGARLVIARTVNVSRGGVLLAWRATAAGGTPRPGEVLAVDLALPASNLGQRCIHCSARVVRVQLTEGQDPLVALAIVQMEFRDLTGAEKVRGAGGGSEEAEA